MTATASERIISEVSTWPGIVVDDGDTEDIVGIITKTAQTGRIGDGKVWVRPIETVIRVRTGDKDSAAL